MNNKAETAKLKKYISVLLLISIAAATAGCTALQNLQDKATGVASENIQDITTGVNVKSIEAIVGNDGKISMLYLRISTQAGSQSVNMSEVIVHVSDGKGFFDLLYEKDSNSKGFTMNPLIDTGLKFDPNKPLLEKGDLMTVIINTAQNGIELRSGDVLTISFDSAKGNKAVPMEFELGTLMSGANRIY